MMIETPSSTQERRHACLDDCYHKSLLQNSWFSLHVHTSISPALPVSVWGPDVPPRSALSDAFASHERSRLGQLTKPVATRTFGSHEALIHLFSAAGPGRLRGPSEGL